MASKIHTFLKPYLGVEGGILLRGPYFRQLGQKYPAFAKMNHALNLAPMWKWGLAIVPLYGVFTNNPPVDKLDVNTSLALASTGVVWGYYSLLVRPRATALFFVSCALTGANGFNVVRRLRYERDLKKTNAETKNL